ncbi:hypothetical protein M9H77_04377 [Catharanthus roseus]|uniref:Uncharacterized protein n=1 Tax=Catharanthus roseus TaxID=4058 RepID=A0ACC0CDX4_CATRO|nr:hypothetical protein M9H77_04377 [Catharanthus roseus]
MKQESRGHAEILLLVVFACNKTSWWTISRRSCNSLKVEYLPWNGDNYAYSSLYLSRLSTSVGEEKIVPLGIGRKGSDLEEQQSNTLPNGRYTHFLPPIDNLEPSSILKDNCITPQFRRGGLDRFSWMMKSKISAHGGQRTRRKTSYEGACNLSHHFMKAEGESERRMKKLSLLNSFSSECLLHLSQFRREERVILFAGIRRGRAYLTDAAKIVDARKDQKNIYG